MDSRISLLAIEGPLSGREYVFDGRASCVVGRSRDCQLQLPGEGIFELTASRHHCRIELDPPLARVFDLGSLNGTFVNGKKIGRREKGTSPCQASASESEAVELRDGDRLLVGTCEFLVAIQNLPNENDTARLPHEEIGQSSGTLAVCG